MIHKLTIRARDTEGWSTSTNFDVLLDGQEIHGVIELKVELSIGSPARATITLAVEPEIETQAEVEARP